MGSVFAGDGWDGNEAVQCAVMNTVPVQLAP